MTPPPPPRRPRFAPKPPTRLDEPTLPPVSPDLSRIDLEYGIWVHGGYPSTQWPEAVRELLRKCRATTFGMICAGALWELDKQLPADCDLTFDSKRTTEK